MASVAATLMMTMPSAVWIRVRAPMWLAAESALLAHVLLGPSRIAELTVV